MSVYENIRFGKIDATRTEIEEAARQANAHQFIMQLPNVSIQCGCLFPDPLVISLEI